MNSLLALPCFLLLSACSTMKDPEFWQAVGQGMQAAAGNEHSSYAAAPQASPPTRSRLTTRRNLEGAVIIAHDGQYLGKITWNPFDAESITNEYGTYGNKFAPNSIFNEFGQYGSEFSALSPWNDLTRTPPKIITQDKKWAYLTTNRHLSPRIDPYVLIAMLRSD